MTIPASLEFGSSSRGSLAIWPRSSFSRPGPNMDVSPVFTLLLSLLRVKLVVTA